MTTMVTIKNDHSGDWTVKLVRRFPATGNETEMGDLPEGESRTEHVWDDCELVIREVKKEATP